MLCKEILFSDHAINQMFKRDISVDSIKFVVEHGEVIIEYVNDKPYPSCILFGYIDGRPIHVVAAKDAELERCVIITAYEPDETIWQAGFKIKKG